MAFDDLSEEIQSEFVRREWRITHALLNFWRYRRLDDESPLKLASREAIISRLFNRTTQSVAVGSVGLTAILGLYLAWQANKLVTEQNQLVVDQTALLREQNRLLQSQNELADSSRRAGQLVEISAIFDELSREEARFGKALTNSPVEDLAIIKDLGLTLERYVLSNQLKGRIIAITRTLRPYRALTTEGEVVDRASSPERGQLLLGLLHSTAVLFDVLRDGDFRFADLRDVSLVGLDLSYVDLTGADFRGSDLDRTKWQFSVLPEPEMYEGANIADADLENAIVADSRWLERMKSLNAEFAAKSWSLWKLEPTSLRMHGIQTSCTYVQKGTGEAIKFETFGPVSWLFRDENRFAIRRRQAKVSGPPPPRS